MTDSYAFLGQQSLCLQDTHSKSHLNLEIYHAVRNVGVLVDFWGFQVLIKASSRDAANTAIRLNLAKTFATYQSIKDELFYASLRCLSFFFKLRLGFFSLPSSLSLPSSSDGRSNGTSSLD